jgi:hypothetical protein
VKFILSKSISVINFRDSYGRTALFHGNFKINFSLIDNFLYCIFLFFILIACERDVIDYVNELINDGALLNIEDNDGETVLEFGKLIFKYLQILQNYFY